MTLSADFSTTPATDHAAEVERLCDLMEAADQAGRYPRLTVERPWSVHNPVLGGEFASPRAIRWYLERELRRLAASGARISVSPGREALDLHDPRLGPAVDETRWDLRRKKLFLFAPERMALSIDRLQHYTGTAAESFQRYVLLTNYSWHVEEFRAALPGCVGPDSDGRQMPAWHHMLPGRAGVTMVNIGVGPSNAKTITDHLAVLRPNCWLMVGHCGGLRQSQQIGDYVLAHGYLRQDGILDSLVPPDVPIPALAEVQIALQDAAALVTGEKGETLKQRLRTGTVVTNDDRNWELRYTQERRRINLSRAIAVDMESGTVAANGYRLRVPYGTLLCVSDKPLHGEIKLPGAANAFYERAVAEHLQIGLATLDLLRERRDTLHSRKLRSFDEPPFR